MSRRTGAAIGMVVCVVFMWLMACAVLAYATEGNAEKTITSWGWAVAFALLFLVFDDIREWA